LAALNWALSVVQLVKVRVEGVAVRFDCAGPPLKVNESVAEPGWFLPPPPTLHWALPPGSPGSGVAVSVNATEAALPKVVLTLPAAGTLLVSVSACAGALRTVNPDRMSANDSIAPSVRRTDLAADRGRAPACVLRGCREGLC
jgi:hypothetical protein